MLGAKPKKSHSLSKVPAVVSRSESKSSRRSTDATLAIPRLRVGNAGATLPTQGGLLSRLRPGAQNSPGLSLLKRAETSKSKSIKITPTVRPSVEKLLGSRAIPVRERPSSKPKPPPPQRASVDLKLKTPSQRQPRAETGGLAQFFRTIKVKKKTEASPCKGDNLNGFVTKVAEPGAKEPPSSFRASPQDVCRVSTRPYYIEDLLRAHACDSAEYFSQIFRTHFAQSLQTLGLMLSMDLRKYRPNGLEAALPVDPPPKIGTKVSPRTLYESRRKRKTLIFDLDETLIHCNEDQAGECDTRVPVTFPNGEQILAGINVRPHATDLLNLMAQHFEVVVFTASHSCYANPVIDFIDPKRVVSHRLFRENCSVLSEGLYTKDLTVIKNRALKDLILVDNAIYSFFLQMSNGVPIIPFYNNKDDTELLKLRDFLLPLASVDDVQPRISEYFNWPAFKKFANNPSRLIQKIVGEIPAK